MPVVASGREPRWCASAAPGSPTPSCPHGWRHWRAWSGPPASTREGADVWFEPGLVVEILGAELTLSPNHTAGWGVIKEDSGLALRFPRFTGRWRDDKAPEVTTTTTTTGELVDLYRTARRAPAGASAPSRRRYKPTISVALGWRQARRHRRLGGRRVGLGALSSAVSSAAAFPQTSTRTVRRSTTTATR